MPGILILPHERSAWRGARLEPFCTVHSTEKPIKLIVLPSDNKIGVPRALQVSRVAPDDLGWLRKSVTAADRQRGSTRCTDGSAWQDGQQWRRFTLSRRKWGPLPTFGRATR